MALLFDSLQALLLAYLAGLVLSGLRFGWHLYRYTDADDWKEVKIGLWVGLVMSTLLWPVILLYDPKSLLDPTYLLDPYGGPLDERREAERLWSHPPPCGAQVVYRQGESRDGDTFGEFLFESRDIEEALERTLGDAPLHPEDDYAATLNWLRQRDESLRGATPVPERWRGFRYLADALAREGRGAVRCLQCGHLWPAAELQPDDDRGRPGWNFRRLRCPSGHPLLAVESAHLLLRPHTASLDDNDGWGGARRVGPVRAGGGTARAGGDGPLR